MKELPDDVLEEICASKYGSEVMKELKNICYKLRDLRMQTVTNLPFELIAPTFYEFIWTLLYHLPLEDRVNFLEYCIRKIKEYEEKSRDNNKGEREN